MKIYREAPSQDWLHVDTVPFAALDKTLEKPPISPQANIKKRMNESFKDFAAEEGWEQINDVVELLESVDAMRKPKSRSSKQNLTQI